MMIPLRLFCIGVLLVLLGCAAPEVERNKPVHADVEQVEPVRTEVAPASSVERVKARKNVIEVPLLIGLEKAFKGEEEPLNIETATFPTLRKPRTTEENPYTGKPITIHFQNADIVDVLFFFAEITGLNLVVHPGVTGTVTVHLTNVPWDQALDVILKMHNLRVMIE
jgi:type II secretory pathway component HofQ